MAFAAVTLAFSLSELFGCGESGLPPSVIPLANGENPGQVRQALVNGWKYVALAPLADGGSRAYGINTFGDAVGDSDSDAGCFRDPTCTRGAVWLYTDRNNPIQVDPPRTAPDGFENWVHAKKITDGRVVVGQTRLENDSWGFSSSFYWANGNARLIGSIAPWSFPAGITSMDNGAININNFAHAWWPCDGGQGCTTPLPYPGYMVGTAFDMMNGGTIVGFVSTRSDVYYAYSQYMYASTWTPWSPSGGNYTLAILPSCSKTGYSHSKALGASEDGEDRMIVGAIWDSSGMRDAFIYLPVVSPCMMRIRYNSAESEATAASKSRLAVGHTLPYPGIALLYKETSPGNGQFAASPLSQYVQGIPDGFTLTEASDISDKNVIAGWATDSTGTTHAFVLTPY